MQKRDECIVQIDRVVEAAEDPAAAYLIRSRLRRALLGCARMVADRSGAPKPDVPGVFVAPAGASTLDRRVLGLCNQVYATAQELCQPSESFDVRWEHGWTVLKAELLELRQALVAAPTQATI